MAFVKLPSLPGVYKDDTPLASEGFYVDADKVRFERGRPQVRGGWEMASEDTFSGICRWMHTWADNTGLPYCAILTHTHVQAFYDSQIYDITPIISVGQLTNPFDTTDGDETVNVNFTAHGLEDGQRVKFENASAVGGITIDGEYEVTTDGTDDFTIEHSSAATSTVSGGGGTVDYTIYLGPGQKDGTGNLGFGTGPYGSGTYGTQSTVDYYPRTYSGGNWGQNLIVCPRGGALYEWAPLFTQTELVTNGDMSVSTGWTEGTGWLIGSGVATASAGTASDLETSITMNPSAYFLLDFDVTVSAGTLNVVLGSTTISSSPITATSNQKEIFFTGTGNLKFSKSATFAGTVDNVSVKQLINGRVIPNAPTQNTVMLITPERILMVGGTIESSSGEFNPLHLRWSDQDVVVSTGLPGNQTWTPTASNQSSFFTLGQGSRIVGMKNGRGEVLVWTDTALYRARYVPNPNVVYAFELIGTGCGLIGPNAATVLNGIAYWMTPDGEFKMYGGGPVIDLDSTIGRDVAENIADRQGEKVFAYCSSKHSEVEWLYPDGRDGTECSRYASYKTNGGEFNIWVPGTFDRTAWIDSGVFLFPLACDTSGNLFFQEKGNTANGGVITWRLRTAAFDLGEGTNLFQIDAFIPDWDDLLGNVSAYVGTYLYPGATRVENGPYTFSASTEKIDFTLTGRQADVEFQGASAPTFGRAGGNRLDVSDTGMAW